jgi:6-phosphogluconolactonase
MAQHYREKSERTTMTDREIKVFPNVDALNDWARGEIVRLSQAAIAERGIFTIALSGGSTPEKLYRLLAEDNFQNRINWHQTHFFFGDERLAAPDAEESNFRMANDALFSAGGVPAQNIHRFLTEQGDARLAAEKMENEMRVFFGLAENELPHFDLILLGMGADGHTASLFPATAALKETKRLVTENYVEKLQTFRLTFTASMINQARHIIFLIAGEDKAEALREVLKGEYEPEKYPAQLVQPDGGKLLFLIDEKAAFRLE